ncbi:MAG: hypothetical protein ACK4JD_12380 [Thermoflexales bacterium]
MRIILRIASSLGADTCVAAGDSDAEWLYRRLAQRGIRTLWLDPYASRHGQPRLVKHSAKLVLIERAGKRNFLEALELAASVV